LVCFIVKDEFNDENEDFHETKEFKKTRDGHEIGLVVILIKQMTSTLNDKRKRQRVRSELKTE
jgi:hypothetical protein